MARAAVQAAALVAALVAATRGMVLPMSLKLLAGVRPRSKVECAVDAGVRPRSKVASDCTLVPDPGACGFHFGARPRGLRLNRGT